jgi:transcriptional regulator with XRE-family HTH domain
VAEKIAQIKELLSLNIKVLRKKLGFSQEKLAEDAALSSQTISDIEGCRTWVSDKTLERLAKVLNVDVFQLFMRQMRKKKTIPRLICIIVLQNLKLP